MIRNSHYVPCQTLRKFGDKLSIFNVKTMEFKESNKISKSFSDMGFYTEEIEDKLNKKLEGAFGNLFSNDLYKREYEIKLTREEVLLIKKFLLVSVVRSIQEEEYIIKERDFYNDLASIIRRLFNCEPHESIAAPFVDTLTKDENIYDYWMRTLDVILDTDGTPEEILKHPKKTIFAYRWAMCINVGYIGFWDSEYEHDEFVITDVGMTSENEIGWNELEQANKKKINCLVWFANEVKNLPLSSIVNNEVYKQMYFHENFMMFPISAKRMIVLINPFFKFHNQYKLGNLIDVSELSMLNNEELFKPNDAHYFYKQKFGKELKRSPLDRYIYKIQKLTREETQYCNSLFLDRIDTHLGFCSLDKVKGSLLKYKELTEFVRARVDYTKLYEIINQREE